MAAREFFEKSTMSTFLPGDLVEKEEVMLRIRQLEDHIRRKDDELARRTRMAMRMESELTLLNEQSEDLKRRINSLEEQHKKEVEEFQALQRAADEAARAARAELDSLNRQPQHTNAPLQRKMQTFMSFMFGITQVLLLLSSQTLQRKKKEFYLAFVWVSGFSILWSIHGILLEFNQEGFTRRACHGVFWWFDHQNKPYVPLIALVELGLGIGGFVPSLKMVGEMEGGWNALTSLEFGIACAQCLTKFASLIRLFFRIHD